MHFSQLEISPQQNALLMQYFWRYFRCQNLRQTAHVVNMVPEYPPVLSEPSPRVENKLFYKHCDPLLSSWYSWPLKTVPTGCPKKSVRNYHSTLRKSPEKTQVLLWSWCPVTYICTQWDVFTNAVRVAAIPPSKMYHNFYCACRGRIIRAGL